MQDVSRIQYAQMNARDTNDLFTDAVDPSNNFRFSDNDSNADNLSHLFDDNADTVYTRAHDAVGFPSGDAAEFEIEVGFVNAVEFTSMTILRSGSNPYDGNYLGACLKLFAQDGTQIGSDVCADDAHGFSAASNDATSQSIVFAPASPVENVRIAKLSFDTTSGGNNLQGISLTELDMVYA